MSSFAVPDVLETEKSAGESVTKFPSVGTKSILSNFSRKFSEPNSRQTVEKQNKLDYHNSRDREQQAVLRRLQKWTEERAQPLGFRKLLNFKGVKPPQRNELLSLVKHYFPPRGEITVQVFDFANDHATRTEIPLGEVEKGMK